MIKKKLTELNSPAFVLLGQKAIFITTLSQNDPNSFDWPCGIERKDFARKSNIEFCLENLKNHYRSEKTGTDRGG